MKSLYKKYKETIMNWRERNSSKYNEYCRLYQLKHKWEKICKEYTLIENYEEALADNFRGWVIHHKRGITKSRAQLIEEGLYYDRPASELRFMRRAAHNRLHAEIRKYFKKLK